MICRICLQNSDNCFGFFDEEGIKRKAADIVSKYFWFKPAPNDNISSNLCFDCWNIVKQFHELYLQAESANAAWGVHLAVIKKDPCFNDFQSSGTIDNIKNDLGIDENLDDVDVSVGHPHDDLKNLGNLIEFENVVLKEEIENYSNIFQQEDDMIEKQTLYITHKINSQIGNNRKENEKTKTKKGRGQRKRGSEKPETSNSTNDNGDKNSGKRWEFCANSKIAALTKLFCHECFIELPNFNSLKRHSQKVHQQKGFVTCCDKKFFRRSCFIDHIEKHSNPNKFNCDLCDKVFSTRGSLRFHMKSIHNEFEDKPYACKVCGKTFSLKTVLVRHELDHIPKEERNFQCTECDKSFSSSITLNVHIHTFHYQIDSGICEVCGKTFLTARNLKRHKLDTHGIGEKIKYKCRTCREEFSTPFLRNKHEFEKHAPPDQHAEHKCELCGKISANLKLHKGHVQNVHTRKPKYECHICKKSFKRKLVLKEHVAAHTGQALYGCPHCSKTFTHNANMHHHRKKVHPVEFEKARQKLNNEKKESWCKRTALTS